MATQKAVMEIKYGDGQTHGAKIPESIYEVGSTLYFAAKPIPDNDNTDAKAVINKAFTVVDLVTYPGFAFYPLYFGPSDITAITYEPGETRKIYDGEFEFVAPGKDPVSWPANDSYIKTIVYADIRRQA